MAEETETKHLENKSPLEYLLLLAMLARIRNLEREEDRWRELALVDELTGAYNFRHFCTLLEQEARRSERYNHPVTLAMFDIDFFKDINDKYGHPFGNEILKQLVQKMRSLLRTPDHLTRYGGEEFAIILPETPLLGAVEAAEKIKDVVDSEPFLYEGTSISITISVGVAQYNPKVADSQPPIEAWIKRADESLRFAKGTHEEGRNRVAYYDGEETIIKIWHPRGFLPPSSNPQS